MLGMDVNDDLAALGVRVPDVLLPTSDLLPWAVVACDQFTSQPEYWREADDIVGDQPSTLRLIFPEVYLDEPDPEQRIAAINASMALPVTWASRTRPSSSASPMARERPARAIAKRHMDDSSRKVLELNVRGGSGPFTCRW